MAHAVPAVKPISVVIVDDDAAARTQLRRLARAEPDLEIVRECGNASDALRQVEELTPDLVVLDVRISDVDGIVVADAVRRLPQPPLVLFVTTNGDAALQAFRVAAIDYLLKPVDSDRFRQAVARVRQELSMRSSAAVGRQLLSMLESLKAGGTPGTAAGAAAGIPPASAGGRYLQRMAVREGEKTIFLRTTDIDWFEAQGNYVRVHVQKATYQVRETLTRLETLLDPSAFVRIHRQTIVNVDRIRELQPWFTGDFIVMLHDTTELRLSRTYKSSIDRVLYGIA